MLLSKNQLTIGFDQKELSLNFKPRAHMTLVCFQFLNLVLKEFIYTWYR